MIDLYLFCEKAAVSSHGTCSTRLHAHNISQVNINHLLGQLTRELSTCDILDYISEEDLNTYMQEKYGVTRMVK